MVTQKTTATCVTRAAAVSVDVYDRAAAARARAMFDFEDGRSGIIRELPSRLALASLKDLAATFTFLRVDHFDAISKST